MKAIVIDGEEAITEKEAAVLKALAGAFIHRPMSRLQINGRRFGYKAGNSFIAVKEYKNLKNPKAARLSFAIPVPDLFTPGSMRGEILRHIQAEDRAEAQRILSSVPFQSALAMLDDEAALAGMAVSTAGQGFNGDTKTI